MRNASLSLPDKSSPKDWDFASPETILQGSGGAVTNLKNKKLLSSDELLNKESENNYLFLPI